MDTPITISSTLSSVNKSARKAPVRRSETSIVRVPISWENPVKSYDRESSCTPTTLQKVNNWINSLNVTKRRNVGSSSSRNASSDFNEFDNGRDTEGSGYLRRLRISSDFSRSDLNEEKMIERELDQYCNDACEKTRRLRGGQHERCQEKHSYLKAIKRRKLIQDSTIIEPEINKSDESDEDVPLSPESEKKKELCSYLQLMKPTDKKTVMILQNRRSVRVKNLSIMQEKRELEKKLKENSEEPSDNSLWKFPELQTFAEVNNKFEDKRSKWLKYKSVKECYQEPFNFPHPKDNLKDIVADFDEVTQEDWFKDWKTQNRNAALINNNDNKRKSSVTKSEHNMETKNTKLDVEDQAGNELSDHNVAPKRRLLTKRTCVINQENAMNEKVKVKKNMEKTPPNKAEPKQDSTKDNNLNSAITNGQSKKQESNDLKGTFFESAKATSHNVKIVADQYRVPKASLHLAAGICDFGNVLQDTNDFIDDNFVSLECTEHKTSPFNPFITNKFSTIKKSNKKPLLHLAPGDQGNVIKNKQTIHSDTKNKSSSLVEVKLSDLKKKNKIKKSKPLLLGRNNSSFKIKFVTKKKKSSSPNKVSKILKKSSSDSLKRDMESQPLKETDSFEQKEKSHANNKEKFKKKVKSPKKNKVIDKSLLKSPLRDTNKKPLKPDVINESLLSGTNVIQELIINENEKLPETTDLVSELPDIDLNNLNKVQKLKSIAKTKAGEPEDSPPSAIMAIYKDQFNGASDMTSDLLQNEFNTSEGKGEFYSEILNVEKGSDEDTEFPSTEELMQINNTDPPSFPPEQIVQVISSPESPNSTRVNKLDAIPISSREDPSRIVDVNADPPTFTSFKKYSAINPLHKCLKTSKQKSVTDNLEVESSSANWSASSPSHRQKQDQHSIHVYKEHGSVLKIFYMEFNLVLCQESVVSLWTQTSLGNVLGAQNLWISKGSVQRLLMNNNSRFKESLEMVACTDTSVTYIELWTKEHQSEIREGPVADVFASVYFWRKDHNGMDKKVLQLQNINGFADDVQYSVVKSCLKIVVSWHRASNELENKKTFIHSYELAVDCQSVCNISEFEAVEHYVSSLHNIEGCDSLIMGCGENKITLWNIEHGYIAATIEMLDIKSPLATLWVKCDRGFLFTLQQCVDRELRLIAIHGMNHLWKKLASYVPPEEYDRLKGVCVENGIVLAFYDQGIVCWNAQTAETVLETLQNEVEYISGKYIISIVNNQVNLRHAVTHLLSAEESGVIIWNDGFLNYAKTDLLNASQSIGQMIILVG